LISTYKFFIIYSAENVKRPALIHENLPRVHKEIKHWNLNLDTSKKFMEESPLLARNVGDSKYEDDPTSPSLIDNVGEET
jgi:hypothetical protein